MKPVAHLLFLPEWLRATEPSPGSILAKQGRCRGNVRRQHLDTKFIMMIIVIVYSLIPQEPIVGLSSGFWYGEDFEQFAFPCASESSLGMVQP